MRISSVVIPPLTAAEADAPRVECAPNMEESIPDCSSVVRNHLAIVLDVTALWGLMNETNNFVSSPRRELVLSRYVLRVFTGQSVAFGKKEGKKNSFIGFPWRDCFAKVLGRNAIPLLLDCILLISSCDKSADLDGRVMANRKTVFRVNSFSVRTFDSPQDFM